MKIALIDYDAGNLFSVERALKFAGADFYLADSPAEANRADKIILPGVGAFGDGMNNLKKRNLVEAIKKHAETKPILGICLGMQLLMEWGFEFGKHAGLGLIKGSVDKIKTSEKLPQIGWNQVAKTKDSLMLNNVKDKQFFYFVHSYITQPKNKQVVAATTNYGIDFCSVIEHDNIFGTQFHPEKSDQAGLQIYRNFTKL